MSDGEQARRQAAVLIPVYRDGDGVVRLVLVRRSTGGRHGGQLALPGGNREPSDGSSLATALREANEEVGLDPGQVEVLEELAPVDSRTTGFRVFPVVAKVAPPARWALQEREIAGVVTPAVAELADPAARGEEELQFPTWPAPRRTPFLRIGDEQLWGLTLRILEPVIPRLAAGEWDV